MTYLVDSDYVADYLKGRQQAVNTLKTILAEGICISIITYAEIYEGIYYGYHRAAHEAGFRRFLQIVPVVLITHPVARQFAMIRGSLRSQGQLIPEPDLFIAATAIRHGFTLVTRNLKDYKRIPDLKIYPLAA